MPKRIEFDKERVVVDGVPVWLRKVFRTEAIDKKSKSCGNISICPFCRKELGGDVEVVMVNDNSKLFPNITVHADCFFKPIPPIKVDTQILHKSYSAYEYRIRQLIEDFEKAKRNHEHNLCWID